MKTCQAHARHVLAGGRSQFPSKKEEEEEMLLDGDRGSTRWQDSVCMQDSPAFLMPQSRGQRHVEGEDKAWPQREASKN